MLNRRQLIAGGAATFAASRAFAQAGEPDLSGLYAAAKQEGELTWYIGHFEGEFAAKIGQAFNAAYPGVNCNVVRLSSQVIYQRLVQDYRANVVNCDVFSSADAGQYVALAKESRLVPYEPKNLAFSPAVLRDPTHLTVVTGSNPTVLCTNTKLVSAQDAPKKWTDFLDPKWQDQVAVAHPGFSGAMGAWVVAINNLYGWDFFEQLKKNRLQIGRSLIDPPNFVASGERKIGMSSLATVDGLVDKGNPIKPLFAEDGSILNVGTSAILAGAKHPNAAKLFMEFILSKQVAEMTVAYHATPVRNDVALAPGSDGLAKMKGIRSDPVEVDAKLPALVEKWRDLFGV